MRQKEPAIKSLKFAANCPPMPSNFVQSRPFLRSTPGQGVPEEVFHLDHNLFVAQKFQSKTLDAPVCRSFTLRLQCFGVLVVKRFGESLNLSAWNAPHSMRLIVL